ncbi:hypothetical protein Ndes2526A_g04067 [Nannochloris sp. 'desiccata']
MQRSSALSCSCRGPVPLAPINRRKPASLTRPRRLGWYMGALNEFHEKDSFAASMENLTSKVNSKDKDPSRFVADTSDEEANLPDPIDFDEEIIIPQRPSISDLYKDVRHEWAEPDLTKSGKIVADTSSDEESNLPEDPLDLDEEMMLPQKHMVKEIYEHLPGHQHQSQEEKKSRGDAAAVEVDPPPAPGSHEMPEVAAPQHGEREEKMAEAEKDVTKMESKEEHGQPRSRPGSELPGLLAQDSTRINPGSRPVEFQESGTAENEERIQGIFEAIDKIAEDENRHYLNTDEKKQGQEQKQSPSTTDALFSPPPPSTAAPSQPEDLRVAVEENPSTEASYTGFEGGIEDQMNLDPMHNQNAQEEESYEINFSGDDKIILDSNGGAGGGGDEDTPLGRMEFSFKAEDKEEKKIKPNAPPSSSSASERLRNVAAKAAAASRELDPLTKLTAARQAYRQHRILTDEALRQSKPTVTMARILEVSAGRAAIIGVFSVVGSEILFGQSVLSQLLGRWEGFHQVEAIISQSRTLALGVIALSLGITATETLFSAAAPPAGKYFGFSPKQQIWVGRIAMAAFVGASRVADEQVLSGVEGIVKGYLKGNRVVVFSKSYCGHSRRAKSIMERHLGSTGFKVVELDQREDGSDIQDYLLELTGGRTVPRVFIDGAFIGGADDTAALEGTGKLKTMLVQKGIL